MNFKVLSRQKVGKYITNQKHIVISYRDAGTKEPILSETDLRLDNLHLVFDDVDFGGEGKQFNTATAIQIWDFIEKYKDEIEMIIVSCELGVSRSSATASAIAKILNGDNKYFMRNPLFRPNALFYQLIIREGNKRSKGDKNG